MPHLLPKDNLPLPSVRRVCIDYEGPLKVIYWPLRRILRIALNFYTVFLSIETPSGSRRSEGKRTISAILEVNCRDAK